MASSFQCFVNGDWIEFDDFSLDWSLAHALRERLGLTGTKIGCGVGGCGSCTVLISKVDKQSQKFKHFVVNACITPIYVAYGCHVLTIEGLSSTNGEVDPIQDAIARGNGTQCGFCTPGIIMAFYGYQKQVTRDMTPEDIQVAMQGNLCRCTGMRPILEAMQKCSKVCADCPDGNSCSKDIEDQMKCLQTSLQFPHIEGLRKTYDSSHKIFQIEKLLGEFHLSQKYKSLQFETPHGTWLVPRNVRRLREFLTEFSDAVIAGGCTSQELQTIPQNGTQRNVIDVSKIEDLRVVHLDDSSLKLGAALTINEMEMEVENILKILPEEQTSLLRCLQRCLSTFGSQQIRNITTIGGSLATLQSHSDFQTFCEGFGVIISYLKLSDDDDSELNKRVIGHIAIPLCRQKEIFSFEKISRRRNCDVALVNAAMKFSEGEFVVTFGGMSLRRFKVALKEGELLQKPNIEDKVAENYVPSDLYDQEYIQTITRNLLKIFNLKVKGDPSQNCSSPTYKGIKALQLYDQEETVENSNDLVHKAVPHASAYKHATGEARFLDDIPKFNNELEMAFVLSTKAHARIQNIDFTKALELEGIVGVVSSKDLSREQNMFGLVEKDEEVFASEKVTAVGQIIAGILAHERSVAAKAANLVEVEYEEISPLILSNEDAIKSNSFYEGHGSSLSNGECEPVFNNSVTKVISSEVKIGSQEHFYMEPQCSIAIPKGEDGEIEIISSTQNPTGVQLQVASVLAIPGNRVTVKVKRVGGGFGGKEIRCFLVALPTAVAAKKFGKPVRCVLDRTTDMKITGKRHFYLSKQKIGFDEDGNLKALQMSVYANAGNTLDASMAPIERIMLNIDNAYNIPNIDYKGFVCKTNIPSNTVMRGTGAPQAAFLMENIMDTIASTLGKDPVEVRQQQLYKEGDLTPYGQKLTNCNVRACWEQCLKQSNYYERKSEVEKFNSENQNRKRGISINPCHFGIGYTAIHLNQGSALVHIYTDGSVLINHGGVEIGQGVHSKMIQIATRELGIPASKIRVGETSTEKVPNSTPSSASVTSDLNGMAVLNACRELIARLQPYYIKNPDATWEDLVNQAYVDRVPLTATGFYKVPKIDWDGKRGNPWSYFSTGTACTEVEIDCLTGRWEILRTDIVMDVGTSLNPSLDVGQIEGAFVAGLGLFLMEEVIFNSKGELITADPSTYKIPLASDIPREFNVSLLSKSENPRAVYSSKTVGEPPLLLATSVFFAVKEAIRAYRKSVGSDPVFHMDSPATIKSILMACQ